MTTRITFALLLFSVPLIASAERQPEPGAADARVRHVTYDPRDVVDVLGHYGYQTLIQFADYEQIENISIGDSLAWQVVPNERGNLLFLKPIERDAETNLTIVTSAPTTENGTGLSQRVYVFSLRADSADHHDSDKFTWTVRFHYPEDERALINLRDHQQALANGATLGESLEPTDWNFNYSFSGSRQQVPVKIFDNGTFTYFEFDQRTDTPAIFLVDANQNESLVNGVRQGKYVVVHRIGQQFTLRNGDVVTCIFNDSYDGNPTLDQGSPSERVSSTIVTSASGAAS